MKEKEIKIFILENVKLAVEKWLVKSFLHTGGTNIINLSLGGQQKKKKKFEYLVANATFFFIILQIGIETSTFCI